MTTYTILSGNGDVLDSGLSLESAANEILTYDGHFYEIRKEDDGFLRLYTSKLSRAAYGSNSSVTGTVIFGSSEDEIWQHVIDNSEWWSNQDAMTDESYAEMIADMDSE